MTRVVSYVRAMTERVPRLRRCGATRLTAVRYAHDLTRRQLASGRLYELQLGSLRFESRVQDWVTVQETCLLDEYAFLNDLFPAGPPGVVVDLGANIGLFSLCCFLRWPTTAVHAVEASGSTYAVLARNRARHPGLNWQTYRAAVLDRHGEVSFKQSDYSTTRRVADSSDAHVETVPAATLRDLLDRMGVAEVDLLKMDIEGAEERVLRASAHELGRIRQMVLELHPDVCDADAVMQLLRDAYDHIQELPRSAGGKPLVLASRARSRIPVPADAGTKIHRFSGDK